MTPFGVRLRQLRAERAISLKEMADALGVSGAYLSALEHGRRGRPTHAMVVAICAYLNIIWDEADELARLARISHPRITVDTAGLSPRATELANLLAELDIGYPKSPLTVAGAHHPGTRKAGERWPDRLPADPGKARFTAIGPADAVSALAAKFPTLVQAAPASGDGKDLRLVRPDGYVGFAGATSDRAAAEAYLKAFVAG